MSAYPYHTAVVIGRWQLPHLGHAQLLQAALQQAERVIVVIGSAHKARDIRNPFNWTERRTLLQGLLGEAAARVSFVPVRDYYDDERWAQAVSAAVGAQVPHGAPVALVGHRKDAPTSSYLNLFPQWADIAVPLLPELDATALRHVYFEADSLDAALAVLAPLVHASVLDYLRAWAQLPAYQRCATEARAVSRYRQVWTAPVALTADAVVRASDHVLLIRRGGDIGHGLWALPGGFLDAGERFYPACVRELREETGLALLPDTMRHALRGDAVFDHPLRSPRARIVTRAFYFDLGPIPLPEVLGADDAQQARWVPISELPALEDQLFEDHGCILDHFVGLYPR